MPRKIAGSPFSLTKQTIRELSRPEMHVIRGAWEYEDCRPWTSSMQRPLTGGSVRSTQTDIKDC